MASVLYILDEALHGSWRAAAASVRNNCCLDDPRMQYRVAAFFRAWAPAVNFPASWPAEDVAAWFAPWCSDKVQNQVGELDYYSDY